VGGIDKTSLKAAVDLYRTFCDEVVPVSSPEVAEAAKLLENTFRYVNIGFIDEFAKIMNAMNIPVEEVIKAASTKPYGFMPFYPNIGIGGHCIPVDPHYLQQEAVKVGLPSKFIDLTSEINADMPGHLISAVGRKLGGLSGKKCLLIGVTYKPNIADTRETPASEVVRELTGQGVDVKWHDPLVEKWNGEESAPVDGQYDFGIVLAAHEALDLKGWKGAPIFSVRSDNRDPEWISLIDLGSEV
jgi:UDP-N-acetyl-D-glucosamine dehydrogenase